MSATRVVVAGLGDTGLLVALHLAKHPDAVDVVGISSKPGLVSGQELGLRLARPEEWRRDYWIGFERFRGLDGTEVVHASLTGLDPAERVVRLQRPGERESVQPYDVLVIATGVSNGFWRTPLLADAAGVADSLAATHDRIAATRSLAVIGGGAAAISAAWNIGTRWPEKQVDLFFPGERALVHHHPRVWDTMRSRLLRHGIGVHPGHRAQLPTRHDQLTGGPVIWTSGQPDTEADTVLWATGRVRPNTGWLPPYLLDAEGFVKVDAQLRVLGTEGIYAIGDVAASDPLRSSARARADRLVARNVLADLDDRGARPFVPLRRRWGSVVGPQHDRLEVFSPRGRPFTIPAWRALQPWVVQRGIYGGIRPE